MVDLSPFKSGIAAAMARQPVVCADPRSAFLNVLSQAGFGNPKAIVMGRIDRIDGPQDKPGKKSGWYSYAEIPDSHGEGQVIGVAAYGCWKSGISETWCSRQSHQMTTQEALSFHAAREALKAERDAEERARHIETAAKAYEIWSQASPCISHGYLDRKKITASSGLKIAKDGRLMLPIAIDSQIVSLQFISDDGQKRFLTGGKTKGGWLKIDGNESRIYIAEGYATGRSLSEATGFAVYIAFSSSNLYETACFVKKTHPDSQIIIAGDNGNGSRQAEQAAAAIESEVIFPAGCKDFNDYHCDNGLDALRLFLQPKIEPFSKEFKKENSVKKTGGVINDIISYYNATSGNRQEGFAVQTALAVCSVVLGRSYKTDLENFPSLYFLNVAKSGTGKEHAKTVVERIMYAANLGHLIAGDGYTSAGAVFSALLDRPRHISVIDEFGRYLEAGRDMGKGNHHQREANTKLMESIGRGHSVIRPPTYSTMTLKKDQADAVKNRQVYNPAITLLTMTTPDTLFKTLDMGAIRDGFVNRFIISISDAERSIRQHKPPVDVPQSIIDWINRTVERHGKPHIAADPAQPITIKFSDESLELQKEFQQYCIDKANSLEKFGMAELPGRSNEMAMRVSLICALSENPNTETIQEHHMEWAIDYIKSCLEKTIDKLKLTISSSEFESAKKEILADMRNRGEDGITWSQMQKNSPYSQHKQKDLKEILQALKDADLAADEPFSNGKGRPTVKWVAIS